MCTFGTTISTSSSFDDIVRTRNTIRQSRRQNTAAPRMNATKNRILVVVVRGKGNESSSPLSILCAHPPRELESSPTDANNKRRLKSAQKQREEERKRVVLKPVSLFLSLTLFVLCSSSNATVCAREKQQNNNTLKFSF